MEKQFDLKKYLVENKLTTNSKLIKEEEQDLNAIEFGGPVSDILKQAGVDLNKPVELEIHHGGNDWETIELSSGYDAKSYIEDIAHDHNDETEVIPLEDIKGWWTPDEDGFPDALPKVGISIGGVSDYYIMQP